MTTAFGPVRWAMDVPPMLRADGLPDDTAHHVLIVLATFAKRDGTDARPGMETLANKAYLTTTRAVADALDRIAAAGLISKTGEHGGTPVWTLHMSVTRSGPTAIDDRRERARAKQRERQRRYAARKKGATADAVPHRQLTPSDAVSKTPDLTVSEGVSEEVLTVCDTVTDAVPHRQLTLSRPSASQVSTGVTTNGTAIELPIEITTDAPAAREIDAFDAFWTAYPRKIGKGQARAAWAKAVKRADPAAIIAAANEFGIERGNQDPKFTPYPATWLNGERWTDEPAKPHLRVVGQHQPWEGYADQSVYDQDI